MSDYEETGVSQLILNKISKTKFEDITKEDNQMYLVNPEYTGGKIPKTNQDGNLEETSITDTELGYLSGVTSAIQTQLNGKATTEQGAKADSALQQTDILDSLSSTATNKALSANKGKELNDRIDNIGTIGRYLSGWNCATGLPVTNPETSPYEYKTGDYYIVKYKSVTTNYKPNGTSYTTGVASTVVETNTVEVGDTYRFDGTDWLLEVNTQRTIQISNVIGLQDALDGKQPSLVSGTNIKTINSTTILGSGNISVQPTLVSGTNIKTINGTSILGSGNINTKELPAQAGQNGKFLTTNGTSASWDNIPPDSAKANTSADNFTSIGKSTIVGLCMPDYDAGITQTTSTSGYTAPSNGWAWIESIYSTGTSFGIIVNGKQMPKLGASAYITYCSFCPVSKGDVITYISNVQSSIFYPCKGEV